MGNSIQPVRNSAAELFWREEMKVVVSEISIHSSEHPGVSFLCAKDEMSVSRR